MDALIHLFVIVVVVAIILWCAYVLFYLGVLIALVRKYGNTTLSVRPFDPKRAYEVRNRRAALA